MAPRKQRGRRGQLRRPKNENDQDKENVRPPTAGYSNHVKVLVENQHTLQRCTDINIQVITSLWAEGVIEYKLKEALVADQDLYNRYLLCYNHLKKESTDKFNTFISVMHETEQKHVANLLTGCTTGQLPMSQSNYDRLKNIFPILVKMIVDENHELTSILKGRRESAGTDYAISEVDEDDIRAKTKSRERNYALVSAIHRRTDYSFASLREALLQTRQDHLATYMDEGVVVGTHVETNHPESDEALAKSFDRQLNLLPNQISTSEDELRIREVLQDLTNRNIPCVAAESGHSIMVYTYCRIADDIRKYVQMFRSGQLHLKLTEIFQRLFKIKMSKPQSLDGLQVRVSIDNEYKETIRKLTGICVADFSCVTDADVDKSFVTDASENDIIGHSKDYLSIESDIHMSLCATVSHEEVTFTSKGHSAADADVNVSFGIDASKEDAVKTSNVVRSSTSSIARHAPVPLGKNSFFKKHYVQPFKNVHLVAKKRKAESMLFMSRLYEPSHRRSTLRMKIRKKELSALSSCTESSHARMRLLRGIKQPNAAKDRKIRAKTGVVAKSLSSTAVHIAK